MFPTYHNARTPDSLILATYRICAPTNRDLYCSVSKLSIYPYTIMNNPAAESKDIEKLRGLTFGSPNIRSLSRKFDDVKMMLEETNFTFLALNETWLNHSIDDCELSIPHYRFFRSDRDLGSGKRRRWTNHLCP